MRHRAFFLTTIFLSLVVSAFAQDPLKVAPQAYKLQFENEWVKVTRVHYAPHEKIPAHLHTETGAAYVYLNDGGPVIFKHVGLEYGAIRRPETKAGSFRVYKAVKEVHEVENPNDVPSDFLRVEFKTPQDDSKPLRGKFHRETYQAGEDFQKIQFENGQVRITRLACGKAACDLSASAAEPSLIVALSPITLKAASRSAKKLGLGETHWLEPGEKAELQNGGSAPVEYLRIEFKTKPVKGQ
jgi:hypothetical protein